MEFICTISIGLCLLLLPAPARPPVNPERLDALFRPLVPVGSPGYALGIIREGRLTLSRAYGLANLETGVHITTATNFRLASLTKQSQGCLPNRVQQPCYPGLVLRIVECATGADQVEREIRRPHQDRGKSRRRTRSERCQSLPPHIPEGEKQEQREKNPFQISSPDYLLDPVTTRGIHVTDRAEKIVVVTDWLSHGRERRHMLPPAYFIDQTAETVKRS
jgi:hypothetical protein